MLNLSKLRKSKNAIIAIGSHPGILQSMLDFDYLSGKDKPDLRGVIGSGKKFQRFFWGSKEILVPVFPTFEAMPKELKNEVNLALVLVSGRRALSSTQKAFDSLPALDGAVIFAENMPEKQILKLYHGLEKGQFVIGPSSVGLLIPNILKLGAIGGTQAAQFIDSHLFEKGNVAIFSSSGGMTNELIRLVTTVQKRISFVLSFGGDRFPAFTPKEAFLTAQNDPETDYIVYFGELGGYDEYELADMIKSKIITKKVIAYIGGRISEMFETPPQFGHAKAMASRGEETAQAKSKALKKVGVQATDSFTEFIDMVKGIDNKQRHPELARLASKRDSGSRQKSGSRIVVRDDKLKNINNRKKSLFINSISRDKGGSVEIVGEDILDFARKRSYGYIVGSMLLGKKLKSELTADFIELAIKILVDHGPYVSGAVNTMIAARAGRDLVSSLTSGLLTIGPRFGGAINQAAAHWLEGVQKGSDPFSYVEKIAQERGIISGIGHKKYRIDIPDPRVKEILKFSAGLKQSKYTNFALNVEKITTAKKANLILNVDGAIAAVLLDVLQEKEGMSLDQLSDLIEIEFFNALFVLARSVGFTAHYLDQRRLDEGLFRLSPEDVLFVEDE